MDLFKKISKTLLEISGGFRITKLFAECENLMENDEETFTKFVKESSENSIPQDSQSMSDYYIILLNYYFHLEEDDLVETYLQKAIEILNDTKAIELIDMLYLKTGSIYLTAKEYKKALYYHQIAREKLESRNEEVLLSSVLADIGMEYLNLGNYGYAMEMTRRSIDISERLRNKNLVFAYNNYASIYYSLHKYDKALEYFSLALKVSEELQFPGLEGHIYNNIANIYSDMDNYEQALEYYMKSLHHESTQEVQFSHTSTSNNIGLLYFRQKKVLEAKQWFERSIEMSRKYGLNDMLAKNYLDISSVIAEGKDYDNALHYLDMAEELFTESSVTQFLVNIFHERAKCFIKLGKYEAAETALNMTMKIIQGNGYDYQISQIYQTFTELYEITGAKDNLVEYQKLLIEKQEQEFQDDYNQKLAEMQTAFEMEQKEKEAELYRTKAIELKKKNEEISAQNIKLETALNQLRKSEISYEFLNHEIKEKIGLQIIGESRQIKTILDLIQRVAQSPTTSVLITGETGTGKELVARAIHEHSERCNKNFCAVNVSSIPETLFESEFFGYKKNAFTGAKENKTGWFEIANEGTLFLDEVGTWLPQLQAKFLRALESKTIIPIGGEKEISVDFRLITATNDNLQEMIDENRFRSDLFYRLSSFVIHVPPLRERVEDIPILLDFYLKYFSGHLKKKIVKIEKQVESALMSYPFPGNVRELKNMIERAVILSTSSTLKLSCFTIPKKIRKDDSVIPLANLERDMVLNALKQVGFHQRNAAKLLGITAKSLERRMIKYKIKR
ncbi:MAG: sigma 54-interacting transcriptional regulator, partial [Candidatus Cloacimonetes bacterium]|nr:sigma 54-interacting transcriptional regulator [Candidatus Cloacimonadota bacterium]